MPADTGEEQGGRFRRGQSGNPNGRRPGARNRTSALAMRLMDQDAEGVILAVIEAAKGGDIPAARLVLERIAPLPRSRTVEFAMPPMTSAADLPAAVGAVAEAIANASLTPEEGHAIAAVLEMQRRAFETADHELRIAVLEQSREATG